MTYVMYFFMLGVIGGSVVGPSNPSPYFGALGLVTVAGMGCGVLAGRGVCFLSLVLFLIYLGGMLVMFAYSAALAAEPYPEGLGSGGVITNLVVYLLVVLGGGAVLVGGEGGLGRAVDEGAEFFVVRADTEGVALMYSLGGFMLLLAGWALLLCLFVVLEVCRGPSRGALRAV
uniref:NADH-ubiquinone oxidoreductase chain 6 n=1 Tax=Redigobius bikolanus TaxID=150325 RepID=A0A0X8P0A8_9GOBI|nr:NADH dehydrogenase subunit 6 [Redigobius bikolanus]AHN13614.1 NADH dehydrogenase subunit 6 [Redigobius bikolanus]